MVRIFLSYSRKDLPWVELLYKNLRPLTATGDFEIWSDSDIQPGDDWRMAIQRSIAFANAIVIFISPDYLASAFIANHELPQLIDVSRKRSLPIIPIIIRSTDMPHQLENLAAINPGGIPLNKLSQADQNSVMILVSETIKRLFKPKSRRKETEIELDLHLRAFNIATSSTGASGSINVSGSGNIFVDAERKIQKDEKH